MMLLDHLVKENHSLVVAHVNYQLRPSSFNDEQIVADYCLKHQLLLERYYPGPFKGNIQRKARELRYRFFKDMASFHNCEAVVTGHQLNDLVETYLLQKQRNSLVEYYGLKGESEIAGLKVIRPLLNISKMEVLDYCCNNNLNYGLDESNDSEKYQRNRIRKNVVDKLSKEALLTFVKEIERANDDLKKWRNQIDTSLSFKQQEEQIQIYLLYNLLKSAGYYYFSNKHLLNIIQQLIAKGCYRYKDEFIIENPVLPLLNKITVQDYCYTFNDTNYGDYKYFLLAPRGLVNQGLKLNKDDWPLTIRNWQKGDKIKLRYGSKKISRWFIDKKIPRFKRSSWPVVLNQYQKIILVPGLGCEAEHFSDQPDIYVIEL